MADDTSDSVELGNVVIIGGGCYGSFYARQLVRARDRGKASWRRLSWSIGTPQCQVAQQTDLLSACRLVVQEWGAFFDDFLARSPEQSAPTGRDRPVPSDAASHV